MDVLEAGMDTRLRHRGLAKKKECLGEMEHLKLAIKHRMTRRPRYAPSAALIQNKWGGNIDLTQNAMTPAPAQPVMHASESDGF